jgi:hypothetical protein
MNGITDDFAKQMTPERKPMMISPTTSTGRVTPAQAASLLQALNALSQTLEQKTWPVESWLTAAQQAGKPKK